MSACWCNLCNKHEEQCDCVLVTSELLATMAKEWRAARNEIQRLNEHHHDPSLIPLESFTQTLDLVLLGEQCIATTSPVASEPGEDTCA